MAKISWHCPFTRNTKPKSGWTKIRLFREAKEHSMFGLIISNLDSLNRFACWVLQLDSFLFVSESIRIRIRNPGFYDRNINDKSKK
jgi:hypothetical protein